MGGTPPERDLEGVPWMLVCDKLDLERTQREADALADRGAVVDIHVGDAEAFSRALDQHVPDWCSRGLSDDAEGATADDERRMWQIIGEALDYAFATGRISKSIAVTLNQNLQNALRGRGPKAWSPGWKSMPHSAAYAVGSALHLLVLVEQDLAPGIRAHELIREMFGVSESRIRKWKKLLDEGDLSVALGDHQIVEMAVAEGPEAVRRLMKDRGNMYRRAMPQAWASPK